jgi:hypothetical protein
MPVQSGQQWGALLESVVRWHMNDTPRVDALDNSALVETLQENMEFSNEFSKLSNVDLPPPAVCPQVRYLQISLCALVLLLTAPRHCRGRRFVLRTTPLHLQCVRCCCTAQISDSKAFLGKVIGQASLKHPTTVNPLLAVLPPPCQTKLKELMQAGSALPASAVP